MSERSAAVLTIKDADKMTPKGRKEVAAWIRQRADFLEKHGANLGPRFRTRYVFEES